MSDRATDMRDAAAALPGGCLYSDNPDIEKRLLSQLPGILNAGFALEDSRVIPYGVRLVFRNNEKSVGVNVYYSRKKGHSTVVDSGTPANIAAKLRLLMDASVSDNPISPVQHERTFSRWIGCDEGGKGAYTGPLVAVAYLCDPEHARELAGLGVADSKSMQAPALRKLAAVLLKRFTARIAVMELKPETYNRLYADFKEQNRSLNHLLAWAHGKAVEKLMPAAPDAIVVDQFAYFGVIRQRMPAGPELIVRTKAEDNIAVAAASVVASSRYLTALDALSADLGVTIRPGAGADADRSVREAVAKYGTAVLNRLVKLHFKNTQKIQGSAP